jgi:hypothetical protein
MNGSIAAIITLGFGDWGSPSLVVTFGFGTGAPPVVETGAPEECFTAGPRGSVISSAKRGSVLSTAARGQVFSADDR